VAARVEGHETGAAPVIAEPGPEDVFAADEPVGGPAQPTPFAEEAHAALASLSFGLEDNEVFDAHGQVLYRSLGDLQQATARAKAERDAAQRALEDLLEEARRAGVPPGWLR
jgi:hypothetical protein